MRFIGVSDAHTDDVATLSGANVRRDVNSTMTASPANLKRKTSSPAERQVVDKIYQNIHHPIGDHGGNSMNIQYFCDGFWHPRNLVLFLDFTGQHCPPGFKYFDGNIKGRGFKRFNKVEPEK